MVFRHHTVLGEPGLGNWFGDGSDGDVTISADTEVSNVQDGDMVVSNFGSLTIDAGAIYTLANRCRGWIIYCQGDCTINGVLSMTARGCHANPADSGATSETPVAPGDGNAVPSVGVSIRRLASGETDTHNATDLFHGCGSDVVASELNQPVVEGNGRVVQIPRAGGSGGPGGQSTNGSSGGTSANGTGGGGGGGSAGQLAGSGSAGTCFSGGSGGGGAGGTGSTNGTAYGGQGGLGGDSGTPRASGGGAGNPGGNGALSGVGNRADYKGDDGTGGLLILIVRGHLLGSGKLESRGGQGGPDGVLNIGGGGSGGGVIVIMHGGDNTSTIATDVTGGDGGDGAYSTGDGGKGGDGTVHGPYKIDQ